MLILEAEGASNAYTYQIEVIRGLCIGLQALTEGKVMLLTKNMFKINLIYSDLIVCTI